MIFWILFFWFLFGSTVPVMFMGSKDVSVKKAFLILFFAGPPHWIALILSTAVGILRAILHATRKNKA